MNSELNAERPLTGLTIMVTRPAHQAAALAEPLQAMGASVTIEPAIEILPCEDFADLDRTIQNLTEGRVSTVVFVSVNGVRFFLDRSAQLTQTATSAGTECRSPDWTRVRVIGIGKATREALKQHGIEAEAAPGKSDSHAVAEFLIEQRTPGEILIVRADRGSDVLPDRLTAESIPFEQVAAYRSVDRQAVLESSIAALESGKVDWVTVTSSAIAGSLERLFGDALNQTRLASISPTTSAAIRKLGYFPAAEAAKYTMDGIVEAIVAAVGNEGRS